MNVFIVSIPNEYVPFGSGVRRARKKEKHANSKWFDEFVCLRSNLSNDDISSAQRPGLKTRMDFRGLV